MFRALIKDRLVQLLLLTFLIANVFPARGDFVGFMRALSSGGVFLLFFLNGIRLPRAEVVAGLRNWRLQGAIMIWVFGAMSLAGLAVAHILAGWLPADLALGLVFLGVLPTTVQSATAYTSLAEGNVAASVVASAVNNIAGILLTPLLFALYASQAGAHFSGETLVRILTILLLPFLIGQAIQTWALPLFSRHQYMMRFIDRTVILFAVYVALSGAVTGGMWSLLSGMALTGIAIAVFVMLAFAFGGAWMLGALGRFDWPERKTMLFSAAHKSIAIGAPLAAILFPPAQAGMVLLPMLTYHLLQMVISAPLAGLLADRHSPEGEPRAQQPPT